MSRNVFHRLKSIFVPETREQRSKVNGSSPLLHSVVAPCAIELHTGGSDDLNFIKESVYAFNIVRAGNHGYEPLNLILRDAHAKAVGGLIANSCWGWLHIDYLWVDASVQRKGFGRQLLLTAEKLGARRKCRGAYLQTFSFQEALTFYERLGYVQFGVMEDCPPGHRKHFLQKQLNW